MYYAAQNKKVVRLKGCDPLIFGRACEELSYDALFDIETSIVPGISSLTGIAAQHQNTINQAMDLQKLVGYH